MCLGVCVLFWFVACCWFVLFWVLWICFSVSFSFMFVVMFLICKWFGCCIVLHCFVFALWWVVCWVCVGKLVDLLSDVCLLL